MKTQIENQLNKIEKLVTSINQKETEYMSIEDAAKFLILKKSTLYQLVFKRKIPFYKRTKILLFKKSELIDWVENNRVLTIAEIEENLNQKTIQERN